MADGTRRYQLKCASPNNPRLPSDDFDQQSRSPARQALSHPDFARYAYGRFAATLAWQMIDVVLGYQVWELTRNEDYLGSSGSRNSCRSSCCCCPADRSPTASIAGSSSRWHTDSN